MNTRQAKPIILTAPAFEDFRGYLAVPYDQSINFTVRQINQGYSKKAFTLRGMHFQEGEHAQAKLVSCLRGSIFNVAVDLRPGETFGHAYSAVLSFENRKQGIPYKEALEAVAAELNLSKASVTSYLPYKKGVYFREDCDRDQISVGAERLRRMRQRQKAVEALQSSHDEQHLWKCVIAFQGYRFKTISGLPFSYKIKIGRNGELTKELWIDRREDSKSLTWSSVLLALGNIKGEVVDRPKALGDIWGVTYIFGMFYRFGLIDVPDEVKEKMKHPKQNIGKQ